MVDLAPIVALRQQALKVMKEAAVLATATEPVGFATASAIAELEKLPIPTPSGVPRFGWTVRTLTTIVDAMSVASARGDAPALLAGEALFRGVVRMMGAPLYVCPVEGCTRTSTTKSECPDHPGTTMS